MNNGNLNVRFVTFLCVTDEDLCSQKGLRRSDKPYEIWKRLRTVGEESVRHGARDPRKAEGRDVGYSPWRERMFSNLKDQYHQQNILIEIINHLERKIIILESTIYFSHIKYSSFINH